MDKKLPLSIEQKMQQLVANGIPQTGGSLPVQTNDETSSLTKDIETLKSLPNKKIELYKTVYLKKGCTPNTKSIHISAELHSLLKSTIFYSKSTASINSYVNAILKEHFEKHNNIILQLKELNNE